MATVTMTKKKAWKEYIHPNSGNVLFRWSHFYADETDCIYSLKPSTISHFYVDESDYLYSLKTNTLR